MLGDEGLVVALLQNGVSADSAQPETGKTPLHLACEGGSESLVTLLLDHSANLVRPAASVRYTVCTQHLYGCSCTREAYTWEEASVFDRSYTV